jgi:cytochrome c2
LGIGPPFLALLLCLLFWPTADALAGRVACLECHKQHYADKGGCISCHRGDDRSDRLAIAHRDLIRAQYSWFAIPGSQPLRRGEKLLDGFACRRCHSSGGKGTRLASNLDRLPPNTAPEKIFQAIKTQALFMPDFRFDDRQITDLVNAILAGALKAKPSVGEAPQVVHFADLKKGKENIFQKKCGPCHKMLTEAFGALGQGDIGPNLSGLFSEFYPANLPDNGRWRADLLKKWLENPRKKRENSQMRPVSLKGNEFEQLLSILASKPGV